MAASQRKTLESGPVVDDNAQTKKDRMMLLVFGLGSLAVVGLMWWLSTFLSG